MSNYTKEGLEKRSIKFLEKFLEKAKDKFGKRYGYELIEPGISKKEKVPIICKQHGIFYQLRSEHLRGANCIECSYITRNRKIKRNRPTRLTNLEFIEKSIKIHGKKFDYSKVNYIRNDRKVEILCSDHGSFYTTPDSHWNMKSGCPKCNISFGERKIEKWLNENNIEFKKEHMYLDLRGTRLGKLRFDFFIKKYNLLIEYDGQQHFKPIEQFGGEEYLKRLIIHDNMKNEYAKVNKINLLRIRYSEIKNINWILENEFKKYNKQ